MIGANDLRTRMPNHVNMKLAGIEMALIRAAESGSTEISVSLDKPEDGPMLIEKLTSLGYTAKVVKIEENWRDRSYFALKISWKEKYES